VEITLSKKLKPILLAAGLLALLIALAALLAPCPRSGSASPARHAVSLFRHGSRLPGISDSSARHLLMKHDMIRPGTFL
jgi:hypothetical protein